MGRVEVDRREQTGHLVVAYAWDLTWIWNYAGRPALLARYVQSNQGMQPRH